MLEIQVHNLGNTLHKLQNLGSLITNIPASYLTPIAKALEKDTHERFVTGGRGKWVPNSLATIKRKKNNKPLLDSGTMRSSIRSSVKTNEVEIAVPYGGIRRSPRIPIRHQLGQGVPQRKILDTESAETQNAIIEASSSMITNLLSEIFR